MENVPIRGEQREDFAAIRRLHIAAFGQPIEADLIEALRRASDHVPDLCLVADVGDRVVGHVFFSRARLEPGGEGVLALAPMAVRPDLQGRGVGSALVREALRRAVATDFACVVVLGHASYYPRFGFVPGATIGVRAPFDAPAEAWMARPLGDAQPRGVVAYPPAFAALG